MSAFGIEINERCVRLFGNGMTKDRALDDLIDAVATTGAVADAEALRKAVHAREGLMSTGIGSGVAVPHVRLEGVNAPVLGIGISRQGIDFSAVDSAPVRLVILFAMPPDTNKLYLGLLAQVMVALRNPNFFDRLVNAQDAREVIGILNSTGG